MLLSRVNLETCEELRTGDPTHKLSLAQTNKGAYGFTDKVNCNYRT